MTQENKSCIYLQINIQINQTSGLDFLGPLCGRTSYIPSRRALYYLCYTSNLHITPTPCMLPNNTWKSVCNNNNVIHHVIRIWSIVFLPHYKHHKKVVLSVTPHLESATFERILFNVACHPKNLSLRGSWCAQLYLLVLNL